MKVSATHYLVCPKCHSKLKLENVKLSAITPNEVCDGALICCDCPASYPIVRGIPRFVSLESTGVIDTHTGDRFADSWKEFSRLDARYEKQFFDWMSPVTKSFVKDKFVLDAGCGKGRHSFIVSQSGAKQVFAIDVGDAIEVAYANVGALPNVHVIQADIKNLPFVNQFDYVFSNGVLHHMADPAAGFSALSKTIRPGGSISIWVYGAENNWWVTNIVNPLRTTFTSKMPAPSLKSLSLLLSLVLFSICKGIYAPWLAMKGRFPSLPSLYYQEYMGYISSFDLTEIHNIVFDHLVAPVAYYLREEEVRDWFVSNNFSKFSLRWHNKNSWGGFGEIPATPSAFATMRSFSQDYVGDYRTPTSIAL